MEWHFMLYFIACNVQAEFAVINVTPFIPLPFLNPA